MDEALYDQTHDVASEHWWYQARVSVIREVMQCYLTPGQPRRIIEIGAGAGVNIPCLKEFGTVTAVEMHEGARKTIRAQYPDVTVRDGALPAPEVFEGETYDVACMFDVLEHIAPEVESLVAVRDHLTAGGKLFLTVPAYQWLWSYHDEWNHHQRRYTKTRLASALTEAGWEIDQIGYFNTRLFPLAVAARMKDKIVGGGDASTGLKKPGDAVNRLFFNVFKSESGRVVKGGYPFGLSVLAVATPRLTQ